MSVVTTDSHLWDSSLSVTLSATHAETDKTAPEAHRVPFLIRARRVSGLPPSPGSILHGENRRVVILLRVQAQSLSSASPLSPVQISGIQAIQFSSVLVGLASARQTAQGAVLPQFADSVRVGNKSTPNSRQLLSTAIPWAISVDRDTLSRLASSPSESVDLYSEWTLPAGLPPSYRGHLLKYFYELVCTVNLVLERAVETAPELGADAESGSAASGSWLQWLGLDAPRPLSPQLRATAALGAAMTGQNFENGRAVGELRCPLVLSSCQTSASLIQSNSLASLARSWSLSRTSVDNVEKLPWPAATVVPRPPASDPPLQGIQSTVISVKSRALAVCRVVAHQQNAPVPHVPHASNSAVPPIFVESLSQRGLPIRLLLDTEDSQVDLLSVELNVVRRESSAELSPFDHPIFEQRLYVGQCGQRLFLEIPMRPEATPSFHRVDENFGVDYLANLTLHTLNEKTHEFETLVLSIPLINLPGDGA